VDLEKLKDEFPDEDLEWRAQSSGISKNGKPWARVLCYVTVRAVQDRLDEVCGVGNWCDEFEYLPSGVMCGISIKIDNEWVTKWDGAPETAIEGFKGGISKARVRTGSNWGVGRYLYKLPATFANFVDKSTPGALRMQVKKDKNDKFGETYFWLPTPMAVLRKQAKGSKKPAPAKKTTAKEKEAPNIKSELQALVKKTKGWGGASVVRLMSELCDLEDPKLMTVDNYSDLKEFILNKQPSDIDMVADIKREQGE